MSLSLFVTDVFFCYFIADAHNADAQYAQISCKLFSNRLSR